LLELTSFTILPESHPWTTEDQKSLDGGNSFHGNTKIGVVIYSTVDKKRKGEVIIGDLSKIISLAARIRTSHALAFKHAVGRDPRQGSFVNVFDLSPASHIHDICRHFLDSWFISHARYLLFEISDVTR